MKSVLKIIGLLMLVTASGCAKKPTAMEVCQKIVASGVGANCRAAKPEGLGAAAAERADFDLPSVPGKTGGVMSFEKEALFTATEDSFAKAAMLAGPHRYGSKKALIFVQMNDKLSLENGQKVKAIVDAL